MAGWIDGDSEGLGVWGVPSFSSETGRNEVDVDVGDVEARTD